MPLYDVKTPVTPCLSGEFVSTLIIDFVLGNVKTAGKKALVNFPKESSECL